MKLVGVLLAGIGSVNVSVKQEETAPVETEFPEVCGNFRMNSAVCLILLAKEVKGICEGAV